MNASSLPLQINAPAPSLFRYPMATSIIESTPRISQSYIDQPVSFSAATNITNSEQTIGPNNAFCYADPSFSFTDYLTNLTKLFNKGCYKPSQMTQKTTSSNERSEIGSNQPELDGTNFLKPDYRHGITNHISYQMSEFKSQTRDPRLT
ncbi:hypothetical protein ACJMK2_000797 [Sinanodonta woodiana]|uniref:Uncharacterized protein n=1 Tax=Sinanodonta woodiana TaxID=1069815 RepID=A0ABD3XTT3_SINWO